MEKRKRIKHEILSARETSGYDNKIKRKTHKMLLDSFSAIEHTLCVCVCA